MTPRTDAKSKGYLCIFQGPSAALSGGRKDPWGHKCNAALHGIKHVNIPSIAYVCTLVSFHSFAKYWWLNQLHDASFVLYCPTRAHSVPKVTGLMINSGKKLSHVLTIYQGNVGMSYWIGGTSKFFYHHSYKSLISKTTC